MLNKLTTDEVLALAYPKGRTFDVLAFAEEIARHEREAATARIAALEEAVERMRCAGGRTEFQAAFDHAKSLERC